MSKKKPIKMEWNQDDRQDLSDMTKEEIEEFHRKLREEFPKFIIIKVSQLYYYHLSLKIMILLYYTIYYILYYILYYTNKYNITINIENQEFVYKSFHKKSKGHYLSQIRQANIYL